MKKNFFRQFLIQFGYGAKFKKNPCKLKRQRKVFIDRSQYGKNVKKNVNSWKYIFNS